MSSLQRDPYPLPSTRSQSFRPRLRCVCLLGDAMCMVNFFFLLSGYVQLPVGALTCATAEEQVSFLLLCRSLRRRLCACGRQEKNFLCSARTSLALFGKKRDFTRADRRPRGRGGAGDKKRQRGALETCATLLVLYPRIPRTTFVLQCCECASYAARSFRRFLRVCVCVLRVWFFAKWFAFILFFSMPSHNTELFRPQLVATRTKRRIASLSEFARGEQLHSCVGLFRSLRAHFPRCHSLPRND